jgi:hypothetical protein
MICLKLNLKIRGVDFVVNLIVLDSKGIVVILGMDWLNKHEVVTDVPRSLSSLLPQIGMNWNIWQDHSDR